MKSLDALSGTAGYRGKRFIDACGALTLLVMLSPLLLSIAIAILVTDGRPVLFRQQRPGLHAGLFTLSKFRTMRPPLTGEDPWTTDSERVTLIGRVLRRTSLDELPELVSVLKGDMSLVGPRPLLEEYLPKYSPRHRRRHAARPGITGLAQVSGRRNLTFGQRLELDIEYVETATLIGDIRILLRTLSIPFQRGDDPEQALDAVDDLGFHSPKNRIHRDTPLRVSWEAGSTFHAVAAPSTKSESWLPEPHLLLATGRQAIAAAFRQGQLAGRWDRLLIPSYFCPSVTKWLESVVEVAQYPCSPQHENAPVARRPRDAVLAVSYFGQRPKILDSLPPENTILDATHDPLAPWIDQTPAAYVVSSLRKTLPIPDGALLWSPTENPIPSECALTGELDAATHRYQSMQSKALYLQGLTSGKEQFLEQMCEAEQALEAACGPNAASGTSQELIRVLPARSWRLRRLANISALSTRLEHVSRIKLWPNTFGLIILLDSRGIRDKVREHLRNMNVFTAVLWAASTDKMLPEAGDFGHRMIHIHADFRYDTQDIQSIASSVKSAVKGL